MPSMGAPGCEVELQPGCDTLTPGPWVCPGSPRLGGFTWKFGFCSWLCITEVYKGHGDLVQDGENIGKSWHQESKFGVWSEELHKPAGWGTEPVTAGPSETTITTMKAISVSLGFSMCQADHHARSHTGRTVLTSCTREETRHKEN